jgi:hypothetical protein
VELERTAPAVHRSLVLRRLVKLRISMRQRVDVVAALRPGSAGCTTGILVRGAIWLAPRCPAPSELIMAPGQFLRVLWSAAYNASARKPWAHLLASL